MRDARRYNGGCDYNKAVQYIENEFKKLNQRSDVKQVSKTFTTYGVIEYLLVTGSYPGLRAPHVRDRHEQRQVCL